MNVEKFLVTTHHHGKDRVQIWDPAQPMGIGSPLRWVLERTSAGIRVRNLVGDKNEIRKDTTLQFQPENVLNGDRINLSSSLGVSVSLRRLDPISAVFTTPSVVAKQIHELKDLQLFSHSGVRKSVILSQPVHSAFVAYSREKPVFSLFHNPDGFLIKCLLPGTRLKLKGKEPQAGRVGESWHLKSEELIGATLIRGWYWWKFSLVRPAKAAEFLPEEEDGGFFRALWVSSLLLLLLLAVPFLWPTPIPEPKPEQEIIRPEPVRIRIAKKLITQTEPTRQIKEEPIAAPKPLTPEPKKPEKPAQAKAAPQEPPPNPKVKEPVKTAMPAAPKPVIPPKKVPTPEEIQAAQAREQAVRDARIAVETEKRAKQAAAKADELKKALGGVLALAQTKNLKNSGNEAGSQSAVGGGATSQMIGKGATDSGATKVGPAAGVSSAAIGVIGGDASASGKGSKVGYGKSGSVSTYGAGGSFVSVGNIGRLDEEGLTREEIRAVIEQHMGEVRYCHDAAIVQNPRIEGKLVLAIVIDPSGKVSDAKAENSTLPDRDLEACIIRRFVTWKFPRPRKGKAVNFSYPFNFKTLGRDG